MPDFEFFLMDVITLYHQISQMLIKAQETMKQTSLQINLNQNNLFN